MEKDPTSEVQFCYYCTAVGSGTTATIIGFVRYLNVERFMCERHWRMYGDETAPYENLPFPTVGTT